MADEPFRHIDFESVGNFRDIGGYRAGPGRTVAWRRVFRSGELHRMTAEDLAKLREEIGLASVIDLRSDLEIKRHGVGLLSGSGIKYYNISFIPDGGDAGVDAKKFNEFPDMGEFYVHLIRQEGFGQRVVAALEVIAGSDNQPVVFHCTAGKDRTGILTAVLLSVLGVTDKDIEADYCLTGPYIEALFERLKSELKKEKDSPPLPDFFWRTEPASMALLLSTFRSEYGSVEGYLKGHGAAASLIKRLKTVLLT
jgi:protein-tyrosine phosphatase